LFRANLSGKDSNGWVISREMPQYLAFYKPYEVLSQFTDAKGRRTLKEFIPFPRIYAAGRLDYRSEGLLLLSDDGLLIHRLTDPRYDHSKIYLAQVEGQIAPKDLEPLRQKILLPGVQSKLVMAEIIPEPSLPERSKPVRKYHPTSWLKITVNEGKKHEVRRLTAAIGYPTLRLVRIAIANITLENLKPGEWRQLRQKEIQIMRHALGFG
jgi:23S rRNA pseudouridine2457 synthase